MSLSPLPPRRNQLLSKKCRRYQGPWYHKSFSLVQSCLGKHTSGNGRKHRKTVRLRYEHVHQNVDSLASSRNKASFVKQRLLGYILLNILCSFGTKSLQSLQIWKLFNACATCATCACLWRLKQRDWKISTLYLLWYFGLQHFLAANLERFQE